MCDICIRCCLQARRVVQVAIIQKEDWCPTLEFRVRRGMLGKSSPLVASVGLIGKAIITIHTAFADKPVVSLCFRHRNMRVAGHTNVSLGTWVGRAVAEHQ